MKLHKRLSRNPVVRGVLCWLAAGYIRLIHGTGPWHVVHGEIPQAYWDRDEPFILAFWHGRLLMLPYCWGHQQPTHMLISEHPDGQFIARTIARFGFGTVAGSSHGGGTAALRALLRALKAGDCIGITPDGPRGPRMRAAGGVVDMARLSGAAILPLAYSAAPRSLLGSWDRFLVPWPFGRGVYVWGTPLTVPRDADETTLAAARQTLEERLNEVTNEADWIMGQQAVEPGDPAP